MHQDAVKVRSPRSGAGKIDDRTEDRVGRIGAGVAPDRGHAELLPRRCPRRALLDLWHPLRFGQGPTE
eukprot:5029906-Alexandrium_andersonii.AAC.1